MAVTAHSKIESLADYKKSFRSLKSVFKVTNAPYLELEMSASTEQVSELQINHLCTQLCFVFPPSAMKSGRPYGVMYVLLSWGTLDPYPRPPPSLP